MKELFLKYKEIILYLIFGVLTTLVNIIVYFISTKVFLINYQLSNIVAWILSVTFAFITNKLYVFDSKETNFLKEAISFYTLRLFSLGIDILIMFIMVSLLNINDLISKIISNIIVIVINYFTSKLITFKKGWKTFF